MVPENIIPLSPIKMTKKGRRRRASWCTALSLCTRQAWLEEDQAESHVRGQKSEEHGRICISPNSLQLQRHVSVAYLKG